MGVFEGFEGFKMAFGKLFDERVTGDYKGGRFDDEKRDKPVRMHGRHVLNRYEDGMEKCIGCELCACLLYTSPSPRDATLSRMPSSA